MTEEPTPLAGLDNLQIVSYLSPDSLVMELTTQLDDDTLVAFVKELDERATSWDFSEQLYKYFKKQHKILKEALRAEENR